MSKHKKEPMPSWFDKNRYLECRDFNWTHWWFEIERRKFIFDHIQNTDEDFISLDRPLSKNPDYYHISNKSKFVQIAQEGVDKHCKENGLKRHNVTSNVFRYIDFVIDLVPITKLIEDEIVIKESTYLIKDLISCPITMSGKLLKKSSGSLNIRNFSQASSYGRMPCLNIKNNFNELKTSTVKPITWKDTILIHEEWQRDEEIESAVYHSWRSDMAADDEALCEKALRPIDFDIPMMNLAHVSLDLSASTPQILRDIKVFLNLYRKQIGSEKKGPKNFSDVSLRKFYEYNLLAVMDLYLYQLDLGEPLEQAWGYNNLAESIFFDHVIEDLDEKSDSDNISRVYKEQAKVTALKFLEQDDLQNALFHQMYSS